MTNTTSATKVDANIEKLESIIHKDYKKLYSTIYRMTENHQDTEDILQNTFLKAFKFIDNFRNESSMSTWLYKIAINEGCRHLKSWNKLPVIAITENTGITEDVFFKNLDFETHLDDNLIIEEMREKCLRGFLRCIPKNMRVCFLLKTCLNLKNKHIAEIMNITENNTKITLYRARKRLKEMFEYRCSLIDPQKPCKCYLWIKYMKDNNLPLPEEHKQIRNDELKKEHFINMSVLKKINYLYHAEGLLSEDEFIDNLKKLAKIL